MFLVGVIPGPKKPSEAQINHCLTPLINDLLEFWFPGVHFSKTALRPFGRSVLAALIPLVCDIMGARQVGGYLGHMAKLFCSFCYLSSDHIENFNMCDWPLRTAEKHRADAAEWLAAKTTEERTRLLKLNGVRHSELLRLPYWNPVLFTVLDTMHAHFLRMLPEHIRQIWGVNPSGNCSDGLTSPTTAPPREPSNDDLIKGLKRLQKTSDDESRAKSLSSLGRPVLWHLCKEFELRRAGTNLMLARGLIHWVSSIVLFTCVGGQPRPAAKKTKAKKNPGRRTQSDAPTAEELDQARRKLHSGKNMGNAIRHPTLLALCTELGIDITPPSNQKSLKKVQLLECIAQWRQEHGALPIDKDIDPVNEDAINDEEDQKCSGSVVLGRAVLEEIWKDQGRLELPSFLSPLPWQFGLEKRKLSADHWRSVGMIHLVVTLVRLWGFDTGRKGGMLFNYMHLVTAIHLANMRTTSKAIANDYTFHCKKYLTGVLSLYKEAKIQPTHHLSLHLERLLNELGPVHSWRAWAFERFNYMLQKTKTNLKFGELEQTFVNDACRAANIPPLLSHSDMPTVMKDIWPAFKQTFRADVRGTRLNDMLALGDSGRLKVFLAPEKMTGKQAEENKKQVHLAMACLRTRRPSGTGIFLPFIRKLMAGVSHRCYLLCQDPS
ncbi:hypothetical protein BJ138DRAFT_1017056 [Hygrophoropsis aurantiaca]|uniref:Uncharacterized protein n=1 Tax=Hygrophoropsis aurantiaca TaxID=72124 RepID=A0ACB7ZXN5_9AGAM|nr:hypothetical protein BJ138DRAFT_1017056 [Hygrophoropsis aurantiaca]